MNSQGWLRSIMVANMDAEKFLIYVAGVIGREFEEQVLVLEILKDEYMVIFKEYGTLISRSLVEKLKMEFDPYLVDKYILNDFIKQGFEFDRRRSQYIRYVYGLIDVDY